MDNLKPFNTLTENERRKLASNGGKKSGEVRRARKTLKEELLAILSNGDTQERLSLSILERALGGDVRAFEVIRDTIGEKPIDKTATAEVPYKEFLKNIK